MIMFYAMILGLICGTYVCRAWQKCHCYSRFQRDFEKKWLVSLNITCKLKMAFKRLSENAVRWGRWGYGTSDEGKYEPRCEKPGLRGLRPGLTRPTEDG